jgi:micrococcal nuclease
MSTPYDTNVYKATILKHHDGDTTWAEVALGFDVSMRLTVRWSGIDAPELGTAEGVVALRAVQAWLPVGSTCRITTVKDKREKFGRYLATFLDADGESLNDRLVREGLARPYDGGKR